MGVLHSFSIKNIFYDKMDLRLYFRVTIYTLTRVRFEMYKRSFEISWNNYLYNWEKLQGARKCNDKFSTSSKPHIKSSK